MKTVTSQTSPPKGIQTQNHVNATEQEFKQGTNQYHSLAAPIIVVLIIASQRSRKTSTPTEDTTNAPLSITTRLIEEGLVRDDQTNEFYLPLTSTVVLKRKQEMLNLPLDFKNNLIVDALVDSGAYVSEFVLINLVGMKQKSTKNILKTDDLPKFQRQVAKGQLEKPLATVTLKIEF